MDRPPTCGRSRAMMSAIGDALAAQEEGLIKMHPLAACVLAPPLKFISLHSDGTVHTRSAPRALSGPHTAATPCMISQVPRTHSHSRSGQCCSASVSLDF